MLFLLFYLPIRKRDEALHITLLLWLNNQATDTAKTAGFTKWTYFVDLSLVLCSNLNITTRLLTTVVYYGI